MSGAVIIWSAALPVVALGNIVAWTLAAVALRRSAERLDAQALQFRRLQLLLCAGYVFGCAYRSVLPVFDVPRVALVDSILSTALVGRSVATFAELCFVAQWALWLGELSRGAVSAVGQFASRVVVPIILIAEVCSWYSVLTTSNLGHVFEESLWSVATLLIIAGLLSTRRYTGPLWRAASLWIAVAGAVYLLYLWFVDIPMYWARWSAAESAGRAYLSLREGWESASGPHVVTYAWNIWSSEMAWMGVYFSVAVWASIWLVRMPMPKARVTIRQSRRVALPDRFGFGNRLVRRARP
jgi:hypothetical protein